MHSVRQLLTTIDMKGIQSHQLNLLSHATEHSRVQPMLAQNTRPLEVHQEGPNIIHTIEVHKDSSDITYLREIQPHGKKIILLPPAMVVPAPPKFWLFHEGRMKEKNVQLRKVCIVAFCCVAMPPQTRFV